MVKYSPFPPNLNRKATQEPTILAHLDTQSQDSQQQLAEINPAIAKQQFVQLLPLSNLINNSNHIEQHILNPQPDIIPTEQHLFQTISHSNNNIQSNSNKINLTQTHIINPSAIDQQAQNQTPEIIAQQTSPSGKSLNLNPIIKPNCETLLNVPMLLLTSILSPHFPKCLLRL